MYLELNHSIQGSEPSSSSSSTEILSTSSLFSERIPFLRRNSIINAAQTQLTYINELDNLVLLENKGNKKKDINTIYI
jgi:hypothetical protein